MEQIVRIRFRALTVTGLSQGLGRRSRHLSRTSPDRTSCAKDRPKLDHLLESDLVNGMLHLVCKYDKERSIRAVHRGEPFKRVVRCHSSRRWYAIDFGHVLLARARQGIRRLHFHVLARRTGWTDVLWVHRTTYEMAR